MPKRPQFKIEILGKRQWETLYEQTFKVPKYTSKFTEQMHYAEFQRLDRELHKRLGAKWKEGSPYDDGDFMMMDKVEAFQGWHHCGGIYSNRICCPQYVETIVGVIEKLPHARLWAYHTAVEVGLYVDQEERALVNDTGQFFIRGGTLYTPKDKNDYVGVFGRAG